MSNPSDLYNKWRAKLDVQVKHLTDGNITYNVSYGGGMWVASTKAKAIKDAIIALEAAEKASGSQSMPSKLADSAGGT